MSYTPTDDQIRQLLAAIDPHDPFALRDRGMLVLLGHTGLRVSELTSLTVEAVSCQGVPRHHLVVRGKGGHQGVIPLNENARKAITAILAANARLGFPQAPDSPILFNHHRVPMSARGVQLILQRLREHAQLDVPITPHSMRHRFGTELARRGVSLPVVQKLMRHRSLLATQRYTHAWPQDQQEAVERLTRS